jgi:hypothetical protein
LDRPAPLSLTLNQGAQGFAGLSRAQHILALQKPFDGGLTDTEQAENHRAVGNRLIPGHSEPSVQPRNRMRRKRPGRGRMGMRHGQILPKGSKYDDFKRLQAFILHVCPYHEQTKTPVLIIFYGV